MEKMWIWNMLKNSFTLWLHQADFTAVLTSTGIPLQRQRQNDLTILCIEKNYDHHHQDEQMIKVNGKLTTRIKKREP